MLPETTDTPAKTTDNPLEEEEKNVQNNAILSQDGKIQDGTEAPLSQNGGTQQEAQTSLSWDGGSSQKAETILSQDGSTPQKAETILSQDGQQEVLLSQHVEIHDEAVFSQGAMPEVKKEAAVSKRRPEGAKKSGRGRKSQKTYAAEADLVEVPDDETLFQRQYYAIGEVAQMFKVNPSLLRFWESEFDIIKPRKNRKGDRHFRPADIKNLQLIYDLLRRRKLTIDGARDFIRNSKKAQERFEMIQSLQKIRAFLLEIKASIS